MSYKAYMKGKPITFRPKQDIRSRLEKLAAALERPLTWLIDKAIEAALPALEAKYKDALADLEKKGASQTSYSLTRGQAVIVEESETAAPPPKKKKAA